MAWYSKYLTLYEKPVSAASKAVVEEIKENLRQKQSSTPLATIAVIAYNEEKRLLSCLWSLSESRCKYPVEIVGINNNSADGTEEVLKMTGIPYANEMQKGPGFARNKGLDMCTGKYYICIDADTMYPPAYIETMINRLQQPGVVAACSFWSYFPDKNHSRLGLKFYEALRDVHLYLLSRKRPELCVRGMTFAHDAILGKEIKYRTDIKRGEDGSMALALKRYGKIAFVRSSKTRVITGYGTLSQDGSLLNSLKIRLRNHLGGFKNLFTKQNNYPDNKTNIIE
ncbi:MAG: glycosyltransferase family 2 protein [Niabella sp.]